MWAGCALWAPEAVKTVVFSPSRLLADGREPLKPRPGREENTFPGGPRIISTRRSAKVKFLWAMLEELRMHLNKAVCTCVHHLFWFVIQVFSLACRRHFVTPDWSDMIPVHYVCRSVLVLVRPVPVPPWQTVQFQVSARKLLAKNEHLLGMLTDAAQRCHERSPGSTVRGETAQRVRRFVRRIPGVWGCEEFDSKVSLDWAWYFLSLDHLVWLVWIMHFLEPFQLFTSCFARTCPFFSTWKV